MANILDFEKITINISNFKILNFEKIIVNILNFFKNNRQRFKISKF